MRPSDLRPSIGAAVRRERLAHQRERDRPPRQLPERLDPTEHALDLRARCCTSAPPGGRATSSSSVEPRFAGLAARRAPGAASGSGGWMSARSPDANRLRSVSSKPGSSCGADRTRSRSACDRRASALNVCVNSSCDRFLSARNWMSSTISVPMPRKRWRKRSIWWRLSAPIISFTKASAVRYATRADRAQLGDRRRGGGEQMRLSEPGAAVDEERVEARARAAPPPRGAASKATWLLLPTTKVVERAARCRRPAP